MKPTLARTLALIALGLSGASLTSSERGAADAASSSAARFRATVTVISPILRSRMTSWHAGCPVSLADLRLITMTHWGFDGRVRTGRLIVHAGYATDVVSAFRRLFTARFRIRRMELVERYGSDDYRSMAADNTSAFNCRGIPNSGSWSEHAYARAVDINPLENPEVRRGVVSPSGGAAFVNRARWARGMIHDGDVVVRGFASIGWGWGGHWQSLKDYQHFSATGR